MFLVTVSESDPTIPSRGLENLITLYHAGRNNGFDTDFLGDSIIIVPVTSYSAERSFSDLKRIKTAVKSHRTID